MPALPRLKMTGSTGVARVGGQQLAVTLGDLVNVFRRRRRRGDEASDERVLGRRPADLLRHLRRRGRELVVRDRRVAPPGGEERVLLLRLLLQIPLPALDDVRVERLAVVE